MTPEICVSRDVGFDPDVALPSYETVGAAGADIRANFSIEVRDDGLTLNPMERCLVTSGLRIEIPAGFEVQVRPRSGLALKHGISLVNTPGTIDSDYRGPLGILVINLGSEPYTIQHGERIAQLVVAPVVQADFLMRETLSETERGAGGFGSTGQG